MGLKDLIVTPFYLVLFSVIAYFIRPYVTNAQTKKYFLPALWVRFAGAILLGVLYQFYYGGGDTINYYKLGSIIYEAFLKEPLIGFRLLFATGEYEPETFAYTSQIYWYHSRSEYFVVKIVGLLSLLTSNTYSSIAIFFASFSFFGSWLSFDLLHRRYPDIGVWLVFSMLFIPSCIFWGSGILKDTITLGALGYAFWAGYTLFFESKWNKLNIAVLLLSIWVLYIVKIYVLIAFLPIIILLWYFRQVSSIQNPVLKFLSAPVLIISCSLIAFLLIGDLAKSSSNYSLDNLAQRAFITSYDIGFYTGRDAGSGYNLGEQDGTWQSLIPLIPSAINVSLFRPYLWEVKNPLMFLSALESIVFGILTMLAIYKGFRNGFYGFKDPIVISLMVFSLGFAFAVGVSTYNFGSLSRYKIPIMSTYITSVVILLRYYNKPRIT